MNTSEKIDKFQRIIGELSIDLKDDNRWPLIFEQIVKDDSLDQQYTNWQVLLDFFLNEEKKIGHCHKGNIYWSLGVIDLKNGNIDKAIDYLEESAKEDTIKLNGEKRITASIGLVSIIKPLLHRFKNKKQAWNLDLDIKELYELLSVEERGKFADVLLTAHNNFATGKLKVILDNFFTFISDDKTREITQNTYKELTSAVLNGVQTTYYSQMFALGSMCEAILDELFMRNKQEIWKLFKSNKKIQKKVDQKSIMHQSDYPTGLTLSQKIWILREMTINGICPITKPSVLLLVIIGEYRDLIHPRRRMSFEFEATRYVISVLLDSFTDIAGDWWPENIKKLIEANCQLNK
jgi:hypothetical protein